MNKPRKGTETEFKTALTFFKSLEMNKPRKGTETC